MRLPGQEPCARTGINFFKLSATMRKKKNLPALVTDSMLSLTDLKTRSMQELMELAEQYEIENASSMRKQELIFSLLSA